MQNLYFMNWSYTHSVCGIKRNTDFLTDFLFPAVTKMHPLKAASHTTVILPNLSLTEPAVNNWRPQLCTVHVTNEIFILNDQI